MSDDYSPEAIIDLMLAEQQARRQAHRSPEEAEAISAAIRQFTEALAAYPAHAGDPSGEPVGRWLDYQDFAIRVCEASTALSAAIPDCWDRLRLSDGDSGVRQVAVRLARGVVQFGMANELARLVAKAALVEKLNRLPRLLCDELPREAAGLKRSTRSVADGPTQQGCFAFRGRETGRLPDKVFRFLCALWPIGATDHLGEVPVGCVGAAVWGTKEFNRLVDPANSLSKLLANVNYTLSDSGLPALVKGVTAGSRRHVAYVFFPDPHPGRSQ